MRKNLDPIVIHIANSYMKTTSIYSNGKGRLTPHMKLLALYSTAIVLKGGKNTFSLEMTFSTAYSYNDLEKISRYSGHSYVFPFGYIEFNLVEK